METNQEGILKIYRLPNFVGSARSYKIWVDGIKTELIKNGETASIPVLPGKHEVFIKLDYRKSNKVDFNISPGETKRLHISHERVKGWKLYTIKGMYLLLILFGAVFNPGLLGVGVVGLIFHRTGKLRLF